MNASEGQIEPSPADPDSMGPDPASEGANEVPAMGDAPSPDLDVTLATTTNAPPNASVEEGVERASAPPVPESGLPEGWTMEQWEHYGHQWLAKQAEN